jgi:trans-aconitate 2-methyltransferase
VVTDEDPFREYLGTFGEPWNFATPDETESRLRVAGFEDVDCWVEARRATPEDPRAFLEASGLAPYRERLTRGLFSELSDRLMAEMDHPDGFDYVRLNIKATRGER